MELGLSLGDASRLHFNGFYEKADKNRNNKSGSALCMSLEVGSNGGKGSRNDEDDDDDGGAKDIEAVDAEEETDQETRVSADPPVQLDLLPLAPVPRSFSSSSQLGLPWPPSRNSNNSEPSSGHFGVMARGFDVNRLPSAEEINEGTTTVSSPNSTLSSFQMDFSINGSNKRDLETAAIDLDAERASPRASDEEENGLNRKKLRLSKEQSAFLEESFKEHNTLNPKQKLALAKQLNLRPRQVEVWFQNRRARTKLKQTEVDCEYLKRCCETLTEENRRLQKELQELRTLKTSNPFYMQLPATTLTMCPSCERVATTSTNSGAGPTATDKFTANANPGAGVTTSKATAFSLAKPMFYPFSQAHPSAAS